MRAHTQAKAIFLAILMVLMVQTAYVLGGPSAEPTINSESANAYSGNSTTPLHVLVNNTEMDPISFTSPWASNNNNSSNSGSGGGSGMTSGVPVAVGQGPGFYYMSHEMDSNDKHHIIHYGGSWAGLHYTTDSSGSWTTSLIDVGGGSSLGYHNDIAIDSNGDLHVVYDAGASQGMNYTSFSNGVWSTPINIDGMVGRQMRMDIDSNDNLHIVSVRYANGGATNYTTNSGGSWSSETVHIQNSYFPQATDIQLDSNGNVFILLTTTSQNQNTKYLHLINNTGGSWNSQVLDSGSIGYYNVELTIDSNDVKHAYYDGVGAGVVIRNDASGSWSSNLFPHPSGQAIALGDMIMESNGTIHTVWKWTTHIGSVYGTYFYYATNISGSWVFKELTNSTQWSNLTSFPVIPTYEVLEFDSQGNLHYFFRNGTAASNGTLFHLVENNVSTVGSSGGGGSGGSGSGSGPVIYNGNGTVWQVADINSVGSGMPGWAAMEILVGDTIYFNAYDVSTQRELWAHDTSNSSTWQVADINSAGNSDSGSQMAILVGDTIYFDADDGSTGHELWAHDTSNSSTWQVADIYSGSNSNPGSLMEILVGDTIYFCANDGTAGREIWAHDTSNSSTWQVTDINSGVGSSDPGSQMAILVGDTIYFDAKDGITGHEIWAHDTSNSSTWQVADINSGWATSDPGDNMEILVGDTIYFDADDGSTGHELWAHDTSNSSTWLAADINSGGSNSNSFPGDGREILVGDTIYFMASDGSTDHELWAHDTSNSSTWLVADINSGGNSEPGYYIAILVGDTIYFDAKDGSKGVQKDVWAHDTSNSSTWKVSDIGNGTGTTTGTRPGSNMAILVGDIIYFNADDHPGTNRNELWAHDTSNGTTWQVADINSGGNANPGSDMAILVGDAIYFNAYDGITGTELWAFGSGNGANGSGSGNGANGSGGGSNESVIWSISPSLPTGVTIDQVDGTISGTPTQVMANTTYTVLATHSSGNSTTFEVSLMVLEDTDGDGDPDSLPVDYDTTGPTPGLVEDTDDDNDGYPDVVETNTGTYSGMNDTGTDPLNPDTDGNGICDGPNDVPPICTAGPDRDPPTNVVGVIDIAIETVEPYLIFPDMTYTISPELPASLVLDNSTGILSGTAFSALANTTFTVYANISNGTSHSWQFSIEILDDSDGDGLPNELPVDYPIGGELIEDTDDDNDGLNDTTESSMGTNTTNPDTDGDGFCDGPEHFATNGIDCEFAGPDPYPLDPNAPLDTDGDGLPDENDGWTGPPLADEDDDNDGYPDVSEIACGSDPLDVNSTPNDMDGDAICDGDDDDMDGDGIDNANETGNATTPGSFPDNPDTDGDGVCDGPISPITSNCTAGPDEFPQDPSAWRDTDGDGNPDEVSPPSNSVPPLEEDDDDDNDGWNDTLESECSTDSKDELDVPADLNDDGLCDVNDDDWDDDGVPNDDETNTSLMGTDPWDPDTDDDGFCDGPIAFEGLCHAGPDPYPLNASAPVDTDGDGLPDENDGWTGPPMEDDDDDNDGTADVADAFPLDDGADTDTDGDGDPDTLLYESYNGTLIADDDDDGDGWNDTAEIECGTEPLDASSVPVDDNENGICDALDPSTETESEDDEDVEEKTENLSIFSMWSCCILLLILLLIFALLYRHQDEDEEGKTSFVVMDIDDAFDEKEEEVIEEVVEPTKSKDEEYEEIYGADDDAAISEKQAKIAELDAELAAKEAEIATLSSTPAAVDFATIGVATASDKDDLTQIKGIGPVLQGKLNDAGIFTLAQLSKVTPEIENQIDQAIGYFPGRLSREKVFDQARELLKK